MFGFISCFVVPPARGTRYILLQKAQFAQKKKVFPKMFDIFLIMMKMLTSYVPFWQFLSLYRNVKTLLLIGFASNFGNNVS